MAVTWIAPTDVTHAVDDAWTDIDVSGSVPAGGTGVILHVETTANVKDDLFGVRKNGSTDARTNSIGGASGGTSHLWIAIGVDGSRIFEAYLDRDEFVNIWLVGYFSDDAVFQTNADDLSIGGTGAWTDVDIAAETGGATAIGAIVEIIASADAYDWGVRKNGSSDDRVTGDGNHVWAAIGVDGSEIFEMEVSNLGVDCFLVGYVTKEATFHTNGTDETPSGDDAWEDLTALAAGATGGIYEMSNSFAQYSTGLRENGSAEAILRISNKHIWGMVEADGSRLIEGYDDFGHSFHEIGYFEAAAAAAFQPYQMGRMTPGAHLQRGLVT